MDTRDKILNAADRLFGKNGFDATSTREIAELSGVNKALIHYHFKGKDDLLASVLDRYYKRANEIVMKALSQPGSARERLERLIDAYVDFLSRNVNFSRIVQREGAGGKHMDLIRGHLADMIGMGTRFMSEAYPATRSGDMEARQLFVSFYGMIVIYFTYSDVLKDLMGKNPLAKKAIEQRKRHLHRMLDIVEKALQE